MIAGTWAPGKRTENSCAPRYNSRETGFSATENLEKLVSENTTYAHESLRFLTSSYCASSPHLTLEKTLRFPMASDLPSQRTEAPPLPVMMLPGPKLPMEIRRMSTPSAELLETVTPPPRLRLVLCCTEMPAPLLPLMVPANRITVEFSPAEIPPQA